MAQPGKGKVETGVLRTFDWEHVHVGGDDEGVPMTGVYRTMASSGFARAGILPITALATAATTYITISYAGATSYGYIALVGMLFQLIPFADLGMGAAISSSVAKRQSGEHAEWLARETIKTTFRALTVSASVLLASLALVGMFGLWQPLLGLPSGLDGIAEWAILVCLAPFAISVPFGIGQRILLGEGKNHVTNLISGLGPLAATATTALLVSLNVEPLLLAVATPVGVLLVSVVCFFVAFRVAGYRVGLIFERQSGRAGSPLRIWSTAGPMLVIMITVPLALQSGRLVLAHFGSALDLASYSIAVQFYAPAVALITAAGIALWPTFARLGAGAREVWGKAMRALGVAGLIAASCYVILIGPVALLVSGNEIAVDVPLALGFGGLILLTALHQSSAYLLTSPKQLLFQAVCSTAMVFISIPAAISLTLLLGAAGPVWAMVIAFGFAQVIPCAVRSRRFLKNNEAQ